MSTITVHSHVNLVSDCHALYDAFKGIGCDKNKVIEILGHRNSSQRNHIRHMYYKTYNVDLLHVIKSEFHGNLERAMLLWMQEPSQREAIVLHNSIKRATFENIVLTVLICMKTVSQLAHIERAYNSTFQSSLARDLTTSEARRFPIIQRMVEYLSSHMQRVETRMEMHYVRQDLEQSIKEQVSAEDMMLRDRVMNPPKHFAEVLYKSMEGIGTDDETLIRVIVTRAEIDMKEIKKEFENMYNRKLEGMIASDTSGSYRKFLLTLVGSQ